MCFVLGLCFGTLANSSAPLLSSNNVHLSFRSAHGISSIFDNSIIVDLRGTNSLVAVDKAIYSASVVLSAISVCSLLAHAIGQFAYFMTYPVLDVTEIGSSLSFEFYAPEKSASI